MNNDVIVFVISSSINSYVPTKYSPQERFEQTLQTISSIRLKVSNSYIIIADNSELSNEIKVKLNKVTNKYLDLSSDLQGVSAGKIGKSVGEIYSILRAYEELTKSRVNYHQVFKISGRYSLNDNFTLDHYPPDCIIFKKFIHTYTMPPKHCYNTTLFSVPKSMLELFQRLLEQCNQIIRAHAGFDMETVLYLLLRDNPQYVKLIEVAGVEGWIGHGEFFQC